MGTRQDRGFRFPLQKYSDEKALYSNFRYLQEYLNYIRKKDRVATQVIVGTRGSDSELQANYVVNGQNDDVEILAALNDLAVTGGEIVFLDGEYQLDSSITFVSQGANIRLVGKGAHLNFGSGVTFDIQAQNIYFAGFEITVTGNANATIRLNQAASQEWGIVVVEGCLLHDIAAQNGVIVMRGFSGATFVGNTATDITGAVNHAFIFGSVGTGVQGSVSVIGNHFENCVMTGSGAGYLARASGAGTEGIFIGNVVESSTVTSLTLESDNMFAIHNVVDQVHQSGDHQLALDDLTDVTESAPADNEVLAYDTGTALWINQTAAEAGLATATHTHELDELDATAITDGFLLAADGAGGAEWVTPPSGAAFSELMLIGA